MGFSRTAAARYSFLLAIPAVVGSGLFQLAKSFNEPTVFGPLETLTATVVAFFVGLAIIAFLMNWLGKHSFLPFVIYRIVLGIALVVLLIVGVLKPY